jgi:hypothetical protein
MRSVQCDLEFGYQLSICSGTKENLGKSCSRCPVAGPSGCKQQSAIEYASPNISPNLCFFFLSLSHLRSSRHIARHGPPRNTVSETTFPQSCCLTTDVVLFPVFRATGLCTCRGTNVQKAMTF